MKKTIRQDLNVDEIVDIADGMAELMCDFNEMNEALVWFFCNARAHRRSELEAELDMLDDELEGEIIEEDAVPSYLQLSDLLSIPTTALDG